MPFSALLMCRDSQTLKILRNALDELGIEQEISTSESETLQRLMHGQYSAVVLDFDLPGAAMVGRVARLADPHRRPVVFAMYSAALPAPSSSLWVMNIDGFRAWAST